MILILLAVCKRCLLELFKEQTWVKKDKVEDVLKSAEFVFRVYTPVSGRIVDFSFPSVGVVTR